MICRPWDFFNVFPGHGTASFCLGQAMTWEVWVWLGQGTGKFCLGLATLQDVLGLARPWHGKLFALVSLRYRKLWVWPLPGMESVEVGLAMIRGVLGLARPWHGKLCSLPGKTWEVLRQARPTQGQSGNARRELFLI